MTPHALVAIVAICLTVGASQASAQESSWQPYSPTPPIRKIDATVVIEFDPIEAPGNEFLVRSGFFAPAQRRASEDIANMFTRVLPSRTGSETYIVRVRFRWDGELNPTLSLVQPHGDAVLATMSRPSSRQLRAVALNLQESMQLLKADLATTFERLPAESRETTPPHRDPL
jgi:hypothetical protein